MKFDFTSIIDRRGKDSIAVDVIPYAADPNLKVKEGFSKIPMWVADMNFATAPTIQEEIIKRTQHPCFGYFMTPDEYYDSIINWQSKRNGVKDLKKENIGYENGVLGGVISAVQTLSAPGEAILVHSPTYIGFTHVLENNGRKIIHSSLKLDENNIWRMDYEDMDKKIKDNHIHLAIFCSPHNPCGRVWEKWEIEKAMEVYKNNDCYVISDEIWSDLILGNNKHIPTQSVSDDARNRTMAFYATTKTFSLAGLVGSYHIIYNKYLIDRVQKQTSLCAYNSANVLSVHALIGAYSQTGNEWVDELNTVLTANVDYAYDYIQKHFKGVSLSKPQGTYMLYLDCSEWLKNNSKTLDDVLKAGYEYGVIWQDGRPFEKDNTIRMNLAVPTSLVKEAFERLDKYIFNA
jgi:cystathionine beta-lyase